MPRRVLSIAGLLAVLVAVAAPSASPRADAGAAVVTYRVAALTHKSSAIKRDPPFYTGSSTSSWRLAPATEKAPNVISVTVLGPLTTGAGWVNVRGVFKAQATSNLQATPNHPSQCSLVAATGSQKYPAVAPGPFQITVAPDPASSTRALVVHGPGPNVHATLGNPYFPSKCSTTISGEPDTDKTMVTSVPVGAFGKPVLTLRYTGTTNREGILYRWNTTMTLKRVSSG